MPLSDSPRRICSNIYGCREAARFLRARTLAPLADTCGCCHSSATYLDFEQHGLILGCGICSALSGASGAERLTSLKSCYEETGQHCPLCGFERGSIVDFPEARLQEMCTVLFCFLGGPSSHELTRALVELAAKTGCDSLRRTLAEILDLVQDSTRVYLERRIRGLSPNHTLRLETLLRSRRGASGS